MIASNQTGARARLALAGLMLTATGVIGAAGTCVAPAAATAAWWPGDGNASDLSGNGNNGSFAGASTALGLVGQAFSFNGAGEVDVPSYTVTTARN